jgi:putative SOS response-associated peptidase YedK
MCGRFANRFTASELTTLFQTAIPLSNSQPLPAYNITPGVDVLTIHAGISGRVGGAMHWGLTSPMGKGLLINARGETMQEKQTFRDAAKARRCAVLASGWYEWKAPKQPYYIARRDEAPMVFGGLYWPGEMARCVIVTTAANGDLSNIHHRAPLLIGMTELDRWLDPDLTAAGVADITTPADADHLIWHPAPPEVGSNKVNHAGLIAPYDGPGPQAQPSLF